MVTLIIREFISPYLDASTAIFITNINYLVFLIFGVTVNNLRGDNVQKSNFFYLI